MKKVAYLGGFYQAEFSMRIDFQENDCEVMFFIDNNAFGIQYWYQMIHSTFKPRECWYLRLVSEEDLEKVFKEVFTPDIVIHRYYKSESLMHPEANSICKKLGIPYVILKMETTGTDSEKDLEKYKSNLILYAHDYDEKLLSNLDQKAYWYPYGVSSFERRLESPKIRRIGTLGYFREYEERIQNIEMFLEGIMDVGERLHVYEASELSWNYMRGKFLPCLELHPKFFQDETTNEINKYKIVINIESLWHVDKMYSHKVWQSVGCGIPTLTFRKPTLEAMFIDSPNPIFVETSKEVSEVLRYLLPKDTEISRVGLAGEKFIHENFSWFKRFDKIMRKEKIW